MDSWRFFCGMVIALQYIKLHSKKSIPEREDSHKRHNLFDYLSNQFRLKSKAIINFNDIEILNYHVYKYQGAQQHSSVLKIILAIDYSLLIPRNLDKLYDKEDGMR